MRRGRTSAACLLAGAGWTIVACGCAAPAALVTPVGGWAFEATAGAYIKGRLVIAERSRMETAIAATEAALTDLVFPITDRKVKDDTATVFSRTADATSIRVELERLSPLTTKISIRVGMLGDHAISQLIMANIQRRLSEARENPDSLPPAGEIPITPKTPPEHPPYG